MIKASFFDLDETLIDAEHAHKTATEKAFAYFGYDYEDVRKKSPTYSSMGKRVYDNLKSRRDGAGITEQEMPMDKLQVVRENYFLELMQKEAILMPGSLQILRLMKEHKITTAIVSSGTKKYVEIVMDLFGFREYIHFIITGDDVVKGKPDPECYRKAYIRASGKIPGLQTSECLVFEDTESGVTAGNNAGLKVIFIPTSSSIIPKETLPDYQIDSLLNFDASTLLMK